MVEFSLQLADVRGCALWPIWKFLSNCPRSYRCMVFDAQNKPCIDGSKKMVGATGTPGLGYPDPDFVFTGGQGCGQHTINPPGVRCPGQTKEEYRTEFALNAIASGQILFASDPRNMSRSKRKFF